MVMGDDDAPSNAPNSDLVKDITDIQSSASGVAGNVDLTMEITLENTGNVDLTDLQILDDLGTQLGSTLVDVISISITNSTATTDPNVNMGYNGVGMTSYNYSDWYRFKWRSYSS